MFFLKKGCNKPLVSHIDGYSFSKFSKTGRVRTYLKVALYRIRLFPRLISKREWLPYELTLKKEFVDGFLVAGYVEKTVSRQLSCVFKSFLPSFYWNWTISNLNRPLWSWATHFKCFISNWCKILALWLADESECILVASVDTNWDTKVVRWGVPVIQKLAVCGIVRLKYASKKDNHVTIVTTWHVTLSQSNAYCNNHTVAHFCRYFRVLGIFWAFFGYFFPLIFIGYNHVKTKRSNDWLHTNLQSEERKLILNILQRRDIHL